MSAARGMSAARSRPAGPGPARRGAAPEPGRQGSAAPRPGRRGPVPAEAEPPPGGGLPEWASERLAVFERHLAAERGLSPHTVRAYLGDVAALLGHAGLGGLADLDAMDIGVIRAWLAAQHAGGMARATLARRAAAARTFTAFAHSRGWLDGDPGPLLGTPKPARRLPKV